MDSSASSSIEQFKLIVDDVLVECISKKPNHTHNKKLQRSHFTDHSPERDKHRSNWVGGSREVFLIDNNVEIVTITVEHCMPESLEQQI